jgi:DNA polymerase III alpha subunit (gram-positive type)
MYIALDLETGGIDADKYSLLTAYFQVLDSKLNNLGLLDLVVKPNDDIYKINPNALEVNKIDLIKHHKIAISQSECGKRLRNFLIACSDNGKIKLIPIGHNVTFDLLWVHKHLINRNEFEKYTSYRKIDTSVIGQFLKLSGKLPNNVSGSLGSLLKHYGIEEKGRHTANGDVESTIEVLKKMVENYGN